MLSARWMSHEGFYRFSDNGDVSTGGFPSPFPPGRTAARCDGFGGPACEFLPVFQHLWRHGVIGHGARLVLVGSEGGQTVRLEVWPSGVVRLEMEHATGNQGENHAVAVERLSAHHAAGGDLTEGSKSFEDQLQVGIVGWWDRGHAEFIALLPHGVMCYGAAIQ